MALSLCASQNTDSMSESCAENVSLQFGANLSEKLCKFGKIVQHIIDNQVQVISETCFMVVGRI